MKKLFENVGGNQFKVVAEEQGMDYSSNTPFLVKTHNGGYDYFNWFSTEQEAISHLKKVGNVGRIFEIKREIKYPNQNK